MLDLLNAFRVSQGLPMLKPNAALMRASQQYADLMQRTGHFNHTGPDGSTPSTRVRAAGYLPTALGECIAMGQHDPQAAQTAWENSAGHRAIMVGTLYTEAGFGSAGFDPRGAGPYWVLMVARSR
jgi:uncharacterized protein YkwD